MQGLSRNFLRIRKNCSFYSQNEVEFIARALAQTLAHTHTLKEQHSYRNRFSMNTYICTLIAAVLVAPTSATLTPFAFVVQTGHPFGFDNSLRWCADGLSGALSKTLDTYRAAGLSLEQVDEFARAYHVQGRRLEEYALDVGPDWMSSATATLIQLPDAEPKNNSADVRHLAKRRAPPRARDKTSKDVQDAQRALAKAASPLAPILPLLPLLRDVLMPVTTESNKVEALMGNVCALFDLEAESENLQALAPITCGILDLVYSALLCGDMMAHAPEAESCREYDPAEMDENPLANTSCTSNPSSLMGDIHFNWEESDLVLKLPLLDLTRVTPRYIPDPIRQAELLTYLVLFRAVQRAARQARYCLHSDTPRLPDLIPGWSTQRVFLVQQGAAQGNTLCAHGHCRV